MIPNINLEKINDKIDNVQLNINRYNKYINNFQDVNNYDYNEIKKKYLNKINLKINNLNDHLNNIKKYDNNKDVQNIIIKGKNIINKFNNLSGGRGTKKSGSGTIKKLNLMQTTKLKAQAQPSYNDGLQIITAMQSKTPSATITLPQVTDIIPGPNQFNLFAYNKYLIQSPDLNDLYKFAIELTLKALKDVETNFKDNTNPLSDTGYLRKMFKIVSDLYDKKFPNSLGLKKINIIAYILNGKSTTNIYNIDNPKIEKVVDVKKQSPNKNLIDFDLDSSQVKTAINDIISKNFIFCYIFTELLDMYDHIRINSIKTVANITTNTEYNVLMTSIMIWAELTNYTAASAGSSGPATPAKHDIDDTKMQEAIYKTLETVLKEIKNHNKFEYDKGLNTFKLQP